MNKEKILEYLKNKRPNYIDGTGLYMVSEYLKEKGVTFSEETLKRLPDLCSQADSQDLLNGNILGGTQRNVRRLLSGIEKVENYYKEKHNVNGLFDSEGKLIKYV